MNATLNATLADLETIGLDELNERAAMLTRVDRKYALDAATASSAGTASTPGRPCGPCDPINPRGPGITASIRSTICSLTSRLPSGGCG